MIHKNKKTVIGIILEDAFTDFAKDIIQSVVKNVPQNKNIEIVVIAGKFKEDKEDEDASQRYKTVYNSIYRLEEACDFDGLLIAIGSMRRIRKQIIENRYYQSLKEIPTVYLVSDFEGNLSVNYDNETGIREAVDYLVNVSGFSKFGMMGGRDDNYDAQMRKQLYIKALKENGQTFDEKAYVRTFMCVESEEQAAELLDANPDLEVIFTVNDAVAVGLYNEMRRRNLVPGKDIRIFGFDNTRLAGELTPSLATIGAAGETLGQKGLEMLLKLMNGEEVKSVSIPTCLYGGESFDYSMYEYSFIDMLNGDESFIYRMFDETFYRYRYEITSREDVNLRRLFFEIISKILLAVKNKYMSDEEFLETIELVDIFFESRAMEYTDASKFVKNLSNFQGALNRYQANANTVSYINRLFLHMRNSVMLYLSKKSIDDIVERDNQSMSLQNFLVECTDLNKDSTNLVDVLVSKFDKLGLYNASLFLFDEPIVYEKQSAYFYPDEVNLCCYVREGKLFIIPKERRKGKTRELLKREELVSRNKAVITFPIIFKDYVYGILVSEMSKGVAVKGECVADQLGRAIYINHTQENENRLLRARTNSQIAETLAAKYDVIYYINSANKSYSTYRANEANRNLEVRENGIDFFEDMSINLNIIVHPEDRKKFKKNLSLDNLIACLEKRKTFNMDYRLIEDNQIKYMRMNVFWSSDKVHFVLCVENIDDEIKREEEHVQALTSERELARRDELTGIKNKNAYQEYEENMQKKINSSSEVTPFALVVCDINNLKKINDLHGHKAGDEHIKGACSMICELFSHSPVFRVGGDEFVVVLNGEDYFSREKILKKIRARVLQNLKKEDGIVVATGMSDFDPSKDKTIAEVFERADAKMYENKQYLKYI